MKIVMRACGRLYDDNITSMIAEQRLKSLMPDAVISRQRENIALTIPNLMCSDSDDILGLIEAIAADFEPIAKIEFVEITVEG